MTASVNRYRASWLRWPTRILCWPLAALLALVGLVARLIGLPIAAMRGGDDADAGLPLAKRELGRYVRATGQYLSFQSDVFPPLTGHVPGEDESPGPWYEAKRRLAKSHVAMASTFLFVLYVYVGLLAQAGVLAADYAQDARGAEFLRPFETRKLEDGSTVGPYVLGTDQLGRSVLSLCIRGTTTALWIGLFAAAISSAIGVLLGAIAGYFGGRLDDLIVWAYTTLSAIPYLLLVLAFSYVFKNNPELVSTYRESFLYEDVGVSMGLFTIIVALGFTTWVGTCRIVRAEFIKHRERDYVQAALSLGYSKPRVIFRHILPNVLHLVLITFSLLFIGAIKFEVILSFLGLGLEPGEASWGNMISKGAGELLRADLVWWQITCATAALFGLVLSVNLFADALRDALDPRLRN